MLTKRSSARRWSVGLSLVEMLISITIGLVVIAGILSVYAGGSTATSLVHAQNQMNEDAQLALGILTNELRQAGFRHTNANRPPAWRSNPLIASPTAVVSPVNSTATNTVTASLFACSTQFSSASVADIHNLTCGSDTSSFSLALTYEADAYSPSKTNTGKAADCLGNAIGTQSFTILGTGTFATSTTVLSVVDNRYFVQNGSLKCVGNASLSAGPQALVENVVSMELTLGLGTPTATSSATVTGRLTPTQIGPVKVGESESNVASSLAGLSMIERWNLVRTVKICLVIQSERAVLSEDAYYHDCSGSVQSTVGRKLRRAFTTTVILRNRI